MRRSPSIVDKQLIAVPLQRGPRGFTLVELLVVVSILLVITAMVVVLYSGSYNSERVRGSARQIQSIILGAQSRTVLRKIPTGIRLVVDTNDPTVATGFVYIGATKEHREGTLQLYRPDFTTPGTPDQMDPQSSWKIVGSGTRWSQLYNQKLLVDGARIRIPANGNWYTVGVDPNLIGNDVLMLYTDFRNPPIYPDPDPITMMRVLVGHAPMDYILELQPTLLPDEKPITFASGMVIDLKNSRIPGSVGNTALKTSQVPVNSWYHQVSKPTQPAGYYDEGPDPANAGSRIYRKYSPRMDILFSPRGEVAGSLAAQGILHLLLADTRDTDLNNPPEAGQFDCIAVSLFTRTGNVIVSPVDKVNSLGANGVPGNPGDDDGNGIADFDKNGVADPLEVGRGDDNLNQRFRYAEIGSTAGK